ncbi:MAG: K(+)-transporting ATPase subunit C [Sulfobacillus thermotolerans]|uniref:Potassium-transporting ATPase KdpC subunit n=1 Tax=Sulfobacillus thermotolerans TaxID=338644 RepID=A0ABN5H2F5_9FIRM|nr:potassium-transporting ATPase subunit C [Sulfobacillus thermotolerans]MCY0907427.1 K(+)-transporting ATPase subunit C [Sulfobacillus thermotolerans]
MGQTMKRAALLTVILWALLGLGFPLVMVGIGQLFFPWQANGSVITVQGRPVAARHVGQYFGNTLQYFWGRPSDTTSITTGKLQPYNAFNSGPSNYGPTNAALLHDVKVRVREYLQTTPGLKASQIPLSLVESSGSGLDPDITVQSAFIQIPRIAKHTGLSVTTLTRLVESHILPPELGIFGPRRINVVLLNVALTALIHKHES